MNLNSLEDIPPKKTNGRILFADDDGQFRMGLGRRLQRAGFECDLAATGSEALKMLAEGSYDVLLADINMPGNQSLELIEEISTVVGSLPVVLLTGKPTVETAAKSVALKVAAYLVKPPDFEELLGVLSAAVTDSRSARILTDSRARLQDWEKEVARLQQLLEQTSTATRQATMRSYLRLMMRNLVVSLVELENLMDDEPVQSGVGQAIERQTLMAALRKTVSVLESTRGHFKSKELGELRKELEKLLG
ncbi:response regulator [bacterium]|nr:response regulator [bacterium]